MLKKWLKLLKNDERGLTLVELLAVIVIIAIIGGIAYVSIGNVIDNSRTDAHVANAVQVINAAELQEATGEQIESSTNASALANVGQLVDPWNSNNTNYDFTLEKSGDTILINSEHENCSFSNVTKEQLNQNGRDVCGVDGLNEGTEED